MMKKLYILIIIVIALCSDSFGQGKVVLGQYFQNLPAFSPAFTGANDYLDIRTGYRKQWVGFEGAPSTTYLSVYTPIRFKKNPYKSNSLRSSSDDKYPIGSGSKINIGGTKLGFGGYVLVDDQGPFQESEGMLSFAAHVPVANKTYLSLGISGGLMNSKVDVNKVTVADFANDATFQNYINSGGSNSFFNLNASIGIHSDSFYGSYSAMQLTKTFINGNEEIYAEGANIRHHILGGIRIFLNEKWEFIPNAFLRIESSQPFFYEAGIRARYNQVLWIGTSYRNDKSAVAMLGFAISDKLDFGYAYEYKSSDFNNFNNGSHEIVLGIRLFNNSSYASIW